MTREEICQKVEDIVKPIIENMGYILSRIEFIPTGRERAILRITIDKKEGYISIGDCVKVSKEVSHILDVYDVVPGRYNLEVSSPGK